MSQDNLNRRDLLRKIPAVLIGATILPDILGIIEVPDINLIKNPCCECFKDYIGAGPTSWNVVFSFPLGSFELAEESKCILDGDRTLTEDTLVQ